jgi:hypothetical protein
LVLPDQRGDQAPEGRDYGTLRDFIELMPAGASEEDLIAGAIVLWILTGRDVDLVEELARRARDGK